MLDTVRAYYHALTHRLYRVERREVAEFQRWIEDTGNLAHLSVLVFVPLLMALVTWLSIAFKPISFLVYPPLAAGTYTLFADPASRYASPKEFVGGMTLGALSGWIALEVAARYWLIVPPSEFQVSAGSAALGIFLTGALAWLVGLQTPQAFSTALLVLVTGTSKLTYVLSIGVSSALVAGAFLVWHRQLYRRRARYLYKSISGDDSVLVPMFGETAEATAMFGAQLAAAHETGKIVLVDVVPSTVGADAERQALDDRNVEATVFDDADAAKGGTVEAAAMEGLAQEVAERLEEQADRIRSTFDIPVDIVIAVDEPSPTSTTVIQTARETDADLIVTPYEEDLTSPSPYLKDLFSAKVDVAALRVSGDRTRWRRILVPVRSAGSIANGMLDFANRLAGADGHISVFTSLSSESQRRRAEIMLENLVRAFPDPYETRIGQVSIEDFIAENSVGYDLVLVGASTDRSPASRFLSPPTFERLYEIDCDLAIVDRS